MADLPLLIDDPRPITMIGYDDADSCNWTVGRNGVSRIIAYHEKGVGDFMPWLAVYKGETECRGEAGNHFVERIVTRIPAWKVSVYYG